jgi:protease I
VSDLKGIRVAILATDGVEQAELIEPRKFLEQLGVQTTLLSPKGEQIQAMAHA